MELYPPLHLSVVAIEKGGFRSPTAKVANLLLFNTVPKILELSFGSLSC